MSRDDNYRISQWTPPPRPEWVNRVDEEGSHLDIKSIVPLDEASLIACAQANTGLSDFGDDEWREPFRLFLHSLEQDAGLNLMGRIMTRSDLLMYLEARLRIEDTYKRHPEIEDVELAPTLLIVGSGRSGTSAMQTLLGCDPDNATTKHWEALFPCPPPEAASYHTDPRIAIADRRMTQWNRVTPEMMSVHEFGGETPTELLQLEALNFSSAWLIFCGFTPSFDAAVTSRSMAHGLRYAKRVLKLLQWKNPRSRLVLKSPYAMNYLPEFIQVFPDTQLVWMHRDPLMSMSSGVSLTGTILWTRSDQPLSPAVFTHLTNPAGVARFFDVVLDQMEAGSVPAEIFHHVQYLDFINDPIATVDALYRELGIELTAQARAAMKAYLRANPRKSRPTHKYNIGDTDKRAAERRVFERYQRTFQVPNEV